MSIIHVGPLRLALLAVVLALAGMFVITMAHGAGATEGYAIAQQEASAQAEAAQAAYDRMMADAYMDNAILRDRLSDLQARYSVLWERAEQATAERDYARSRLGAYEPRFRDHPIDALAAPRPGTTTTQIQGGR